MQRVPPLECLGRMCNGLVSHGVKLPRRDRTITGRDIVIPAAWQVDSNASLHPLENVGETGDLMVPRLNYFVVFFVLLACAASFLSVLADSCIFPATEPSIALTFTSSTPLFPGTLMS